MRPEWFVLALVQSYCKDQSTWQEGVLELLKKKKIMVVSISSIRFCVHCSDIYNGTGTTGWIKMSTILRRINRIWCSHAFLRVSCRKLPTRFFLFWQKAICFSILPLRYQQVFPTKKPKILARTIRKYNFSLTRQDQYEAFIRHFYRRSLLIKETWTFPS